MWLAVGEHLLDEFPSTYRRLGAGFAGGVGGTHQEVCGALSGSILAISALLGRSSLQENDHPARDLSALYWAHFLGQYGDTRCAPLRGRIKAPGGIGQDINSCAALVEKATKLLLEILNRSPYVK